MLSRSLLLAAISMYAVGSAAQYNDKGTVHIALGATIGAYATEYDQTINVLGFPLRTTNSGGAATLTVPIEFHYGLARIFSLGIYAEPGRYVDSVASRRNAISMLGLQPRFYLVNMDRFAWMAGLQLGVTRLQIDDEETPGSPKSMYRGGHFGLNTGVGFLFTDAFGLQLQLRYLANTLPLREYELYGQNVALDLVDAELRANGIGIQASLNLCF